MEQGTQPLAEAALPANATTALAQSYRQHLRVVLSVVRAASREGMSA